MINFNHCYLPISKIRSLKSIAHCLYLCISTLITLAIPGYWLYKVITSAKSYSKSYPNDPKLHRSMQRFSALMGFIAVVFCTSPLIIILSFSIVAPNLSTPTAMDIIAVAMALAFNLGNMPNIFDFSLKQIFRLISWYRNRDDHAILNPTNPIKYSISVISADGAHKLKAMARELVQRQFSYRYDDIAVKPVGDAAIQASIHLTIWKNRTANRAEVMALKFTAKQRNDALKKLYLAKKAIKGNPNRFFGLSPQQQAACQAINRAIKYFSYMLNERDEFYIPANAGTLPSDMNEPGIQSFNYDQPSDFCNSYKSFIGCSSFDLLTTSLAGLFVDTPLALQLQDTNPPTLGKDLSLQDIQFLKFLDINLEHVCRCERHQAIALTQPALNKL